MFYNNQEAKNWHEGTSMYRGYSVYRFKNSLTPGTPENPQKHPQNTPKIKIFKICRVGSLRKGMIQENNKI